jgi:hypothetical protein
MSTYADLSTVALALHDAQATLQTKRAALEAKEPSVAAVLTTEQAAIDSATATFEAAREVARESTGWNTANAELSAAQTAYTDAKLNWETVISSLAPLE